uniref:Uncharacterized protein n=1 Tax=Schistocephalus solidus TaxID=70667 RepID=A0A0V0J7L2_SCHSO
MTQRDVHGSILLIRKRSFAKIADLDVWVPILPVGLHCFHFHCRARIAQKKLGQSPVRLAFMPADAPNGGGFFKYRLGDGLHCGLVDTAGVVHSYVPSEGFRSEANSWDQSILVVMPDSTCVSDERWELSIQKCMDDTKTKQLRMTTDPQRAALLAYYHGRNARKTKPDYDCLDFAVCVVNHAFETDVHTRDTISEIMCRQLKSVLQYADCQRVAAAFRLCL